ncbi:hypothetical protein [Kistimonas asteriae]|uniref:hypothetical protein n=1 Tax=Kistimonas asteriae TaxID=517724 RepID=UPI001BAA95AC|nr:hypothetical protein [Kistimonas asteriae]
MSSIQAKTSLPLDPALLDVNSTSHYLTNSIPTKEPETIGDKIPPSKTRFQTIRERLCSFWDRYFCRLSDCCCYKLWEKILILLKIRKPEESQEEDSDDVSDPIYFIQLSDRDFKNTPPMCEIVDIQKPVSTSTTHPFLGDIQPHLPALQPHCSDKAVSPAPPPMTTTVTLKREKYEKQFSPYSNGETTTSFTPLNTMAPSAPIKEEVIVASIDIHQKKVSTNSRDQEENHYETLLKSADAIEFPVMALDYEDTDTTSQSSNDTVVSEIYRPLDITHSHSEVWQEQGSPEGLSSVNLATDEAPPMEDPDLEAEATADLTALERAQQAGIQTSPDFYRRVALYEMMYSVQQLLQQLEDDAICHLLPAELWIDLNSNLHVLGSTFTHLGLFDKKQNNIEKQNRYIAALVSKQTIEDLDPELAIFVKSIRDLNFLMNKLKKLTDSLTDKKLFIQAFKHNIDTINELISLLYHSKELQWEDKDYLNYFREKRSSFGFTPSGSFFRYKESETPLKLRDDRGNQPDSDRQEHHTQSADCIPPLIDVMTSTDLEACSIDALLDDEQLCKLQHCYEELDEWLSAVPHKSLTQSVSLNSLYPRAYTNKQNGKI